MQDLLARASGTGIRAFAAITTNLAEEARRRHSLYPTAAAALGRTMTAAILLAANLKTEETITIRIKGDGPLGQVVADARANGTVRGYVDNPQVELPLINGKLAVGQAVGEGFIHVTRFTGMKDPFTGSVPLVSGEIAEDVTNYLLVSEQIPSSVALGVLVDTDLSVSAAGGFLVQALPGADDETLRRVEKNIASMPPISQLIKQGGKLADIFQYLFEGIEYRISEQTALAFSCSCDRARVEKILISLGKQELEELVTEGQAELTCHFCSQQYRFSKQELLTLGNISDKNA